MHAPCAEGSVTSVGAAFRTLVNRPSSSLSWVSPIYASRLIGTKSSRESSRRIGANRCASCVASASDTADCRGISDDLGPCWCTKSTKKTPAITSATMFRTSSAASVARTWTHHGAWAKRPNPLCCGRGSATVAGEQLCERLGRELDDGLALVAPIDARPRSVLVERDEAGGGRHHDRVRRVAARLDELHVGLRLDHAGDQVAEHPGHGGEDDPGGRHGAARSLSDRRCPAAVGRRRPPGPGRRAG